MEPESLPAASQPDFPALDVQVGKIFTPATPVNLEAVFAGRIEQVRLVADAVNQPGQHAIVFGERGVGKTSLANIVSSRLKSSSPTIPILSPRVNCDGSDTFHSLWLKVFSAIRVKQKTMVGFTPTPSSVGLAERLPEQIRPDNVREILTDLGQSAVVIVVIDEFDRLADPTLKSLFADLIKMMSDQVVPATLVLVGVADTVDQLIEAHQSVSRALVQVQMQRMSQSELEDVLKQGIRLLGLSIDADAMRTISMLSLGLPHYTHLLGLHATREAIDERSRRIGEAHVSAAVRKALERAQQSIRSSYHKATSSQRRDNLYAPVLLACALAPLDELGYFQPADLKAPMSDIMGRQYAIANFSRHLNDFCDAGRGPVLQRKGEKHRYRYRFVDALMQPFVTLKGIADKQITRSAIEKFTPRVPRRGRRVTDGA
jgi:Cdc6-like AAA superfamily ATPase